MSANHLYLRAKIAHAIAAFTLHFSSATRPNKPLYHKNGNENAFFAKEVSNSLHGAWSCHQIRILGGRESVLKAIRVGGRVGN